MQKTAVKLDKDNRKNRKAGELFIRGDRLYEQNNEGNRYRVDNPERNPLPKTIKESLTNKFTEFKGK